MCFLFYTVGDDCGTRSECFRRVIDGKNAGLWPWQAIITENNFFRAGGVLINNQWVLSVAHSAIGWNYGNVKVFLGTVF